MPLQFLIQRSLSITPIKSTALIGHTRKSEGRKILESLTAPAWKKYRSGAYIDWKISMISLDYNPQVFR